MDDVYYAREAVSGRKGGVSLAAGQAVEVLDISDGDFWLVRTVDPSTAREEGMVASSNLSPTPPTKTRERGGRVKGVSNEGVASSSSSSTAAVMPGALFGRYEPPKSMVFGKPELEERGGEDVEVERTEEGKKREDTHAFVAMEMPGEREDPSPKDPAPVIRLQLTEVVDELQKLQETLVNPSVQLDPVEVYIAIADFKGTEDSNISLRAGEHVQVGVASLVT